MNLSEWLPFLIPLLLAEALLLGLTLSHIFTHSTYKRGTRAMWVIITILGMEFIGPLLYFLLGKEDA